MGIDKEKNENKLILEMLNLMSEMAQKLTELDANVGELEEYVDDIDADLADMEDLLFDDEDDDDDDCDCDCDACGGFEDDEEIGISCPNCGEDIVIKAADIDFDESPVCSACGKPLFVDEPENDE